MSELTNKYMYNNLMVSFKINISETASFTASFSITSLCLFRLRYYIKMRKMLQREWNSKLFSDVAERSSKIQTLLCVEVFKTSVEGDGG